MPLREMIIVSEFYIYVHVIMPLFFFFWCSYIHMFYVYDVFVLITCMRMMYARYKCIMRITHTFNVYACAHFWMRTCSIWTISTCLLNFCYLFVFAIFRRLFLSARPSISGKWKLLSWRHNMQDVQQMICFYNDA